MNAARKQKIKNFITKLPFGKQLLKLRWKINKFNKNISTRKRLRSKHFYLARSIENWDIYQKYSEVPVQDTMVFEIGSGPFLVSSIGLSLYGFKNITTVDVNRIVVPEYVQTVIKYYYKHAQYFGLKKHINIKKKITNKNLEQIISQNFNNVNYLAPYDTSKPFNVITDSSIDFVFANFVFEYVNQNTLLNIINESFRILRVGGIFYTSINFRDHRAYRTNPLYQKHPKLTFYDHLQYSNSEWTNLTKEWGKKQIGFGSYQNRLRTSDYLAMFEAAGFEVLEVKKYDITDEDRAAFATVKVHEEFKQKYTDEELMEKGVNFVLRKPLWN